MKLYEKRRQCRRKKLIFSSAFIFSGFIFSAGLKMQYQPIEASVQTSKVLPAVMAAPEIVTAPERVKMESRYPEFSYSKTWSSEDSYLLAKIAMAEAEGESIRGKSLVILVVLNRIHDPNFPNAIRDVIFEDGQFLPIADGRFNRVEPDADCWEALRLVKDAPYDYSDGALYFESCTNTDNWHSNNLNFLYQCGNHKFYK